VRGNIVAKKGKLWMLRTSPHNEEILWKLAKSEEDLKKIAVAYIHEYFFEVKWIEGRVDWANEVVEVKYGEDKDDVSEKTFYISDVEFV
jgi:hypothetical protein